MHRLIAASLNFRLLVVAIAAVVMLFGIAQLRQLSVDILPEFESPRVEIQTEAPGLSAEEVESLISLNLEELLSGTSWLKTIHSTSVPGLSYVQLIFESGTDLMRARQLVQERLSLAYTLPNVSQPPVMLQPLSATSRTMMIGLSADEMSPIQLSVLARWTIKPRLLGVPGVANVAIWGQRDRQLQVLVDPERLAAKGLTQEQIIRTTGDAMWVSPLSFLNASAPGTGGWIDTPNQRLGVQHTQPISSPEDLARVSVDGATNLRLSDVTEVVEGHPPLIGDAVLNQGAGLLLVIEKSPAANTLAVTRGVEAALAGLQPGLSGVKVDSQVFRSASFIETAIDNLASALVLGAVLAVLILLAFLFEWRVVFISLVAIVLSLLAALGVLYVRGVTINTMVLTGLVIALAVVIDDAIVDVEHIARRLRRPAQAETSSRGPSAMRTVLEASLQMRGPLIYATLIIGLTTLPIFAMTGEVGAFFRPLVISYALVVAASLVVALTVTPALSLWLLRPTARPLWPKSLMVRLQRGYNSRLAQAIRTPRRAYLIAGIVVVIAIAVWPKLTQEILPSFQERHLLIDWTGAPGTSHPEMYRLLTAAGRELGSLPGVSNVGMHLGRAVTGDQVVGINASQLWVTVDHTADYEATVADIRQTVAGYPGLTGTVQTYLTKRVREALTGVSKPIVVRLYGPSREVLRAKAEEVRGALAQIDGVVDLQVEGQVEEPYVQIQVDLAKAERYGLKPGDVRRQTATVFAGLAVGSLFEQQKVFDVVVWGVPAVRDNVTDIREFLLETPGGGHVRLEDVADVRVASTPTTIEHEATSPRIDIVANVRGRNPDAVVDDVEARLQGIKFPLEYHPELLGEYAEREADLNRLLSVAVAAAIGIFLLLQALLKSWRLAGLSFAATSFPLLGGVLAVATSGGVISLGSAIGFLAILGIGARQTVVLFSQYRDQEQRTGEVAGPELVQQITQEQFVPLLVRTATIAAALLPMVFLGNRAGLEIVHPMAIVILGGLIASACGQLFVVPALYLRFRPVSQSNAPGASRGQDGHSQFV